MFETAMNGHSQGSRVGTAKGRNLFLVVPKRDAKVTYEGETVELRVGRDQLHPDHQIVRDLPHLFESLSARESRVGTPTERRARRRAAGTPGGWPRVTREEFAAHLDNAGPWPHVLQSEWDAMCSRTIASSSARRAG